MRQHSRDASSDGDRASFDIQYKLDISNRKNKLGETFKADSGLDFQDFKDIGDGRSQKSYITSQRKVLPSDLVKRSEQSFIITQNPTQNPLKREGGSFLQEGPSVSEMTHGQYSSMGINKSYRNVVRTNTNHLFSRTNEENFFKETPNLEIKTKLSMEEENLQQSIKFNQISSPQFQNQRYLSYNVSSSRRKIQQTPQNQYKDTAFKIQYFSNENEKLDYQTIKIMQEIQKYQKMLSTNLDFQEQLTQIQQQTNTLNLKISEQRSLQRALGQSKRNIEQQFEKVAISLQSMRFSHPIFTKDDTKAILQQIDTLKNEFQQMRRDEGSLNLSTTLYNPATSQQLQSYRLSFLPDRQAKSFNPEEQIMKQSIDQIKQKSNSYTTQFLTNLKMMIIKDDWKMFENSDVCINCSTRQYPLLHVKIGNKSNKNLLNFTVKQAATIITDKQTLLARNYFVHTYKMRTISQPFLPIQITYNSSENDDKTKINLFLPIMTIKHGEFIPITQKQYSQQCLQHINVFEQFSTPYKLLDANIIQKDIKQFKLFYPNLIYENNEDKSKLKGIFKMWNSNEGALVQIQQKGNLVSVSVKNNIPFLLQTLQFLLTQII